MGRNSDMRHKGALYGRLIASRRGLSLRTEIEVPMGNDYRRSRCLSSQYTVHSTGKGALILKLNVGYRLKAHSGDEGCPEVM